MIKRFRCALILVPIGLFGCGQDPEPPPEVAAEPAQPPALPAQTPQTPFSEAQEQVDRARDFLDKVQAGLELAQALKAAVEDVVERTGEIPADPDGVAQTRAIPPADSGVESISLVDDGLIVIDFSADGEIPGGTIELRPTLNGSSVTWSCSGGTLPAEFRPDDCG